MSRSYVERILRARVYDVARESPLHPAVRLSERTGNHVLLKREDEQQVFSFKLRGAYNKMNRLTQAQRDRGVVAASAGNHAQGLAMAAQRMGVKATIVMPRTTPQIKVDAVRERAAVTQEELLSRLSEQLNQRMYVLSIVAAVFLPLGFLTGLLGINVGGIPGADNAQAFWIFSGLLLIAVVIQLLVFRWKKWL